jgi:hypothetical protein
LGSFGETVRSITPLRSLPVANSFSIPPATTSTPYSTPTGSNTIGQQQIQFGPHLLVLRVENPAEGYVLTAVRTRTDLAGA